MQHTKHDVFLLLCPWARQQCCLGRLNAPARTMTAAMMIRRTPALCRLPMLFPVRIVAADLGDLHIYLGICCCSNMYIGCVICHNFVRWFERVEQNSSACCRSESRRFRHCVRHVVKKAGGDTSLEMCTNFR